MLFLKALNTDYVNTNLDKRRKIKYPFYHLFDSEIIKIIEELKKMKAEQVQSCFVFFWSFVNVLLEILASFLAIRLNKKAQDQKEMILQKNGVISE